MLNQEAHMMDPVSLFARATDHAAVVIAAVAVDQLGGPTPCAEWTVQDLMDHLVGSTRYLLAAAGAADPLAAGPATAETYRTGRAAVLEALTASGVLERTCVSPLGFEWSLAEATMGTFMDSLVHTWDLAVAIGSDPALDPELVDACVAVFLPDMPERGRAAGLVGPAVTLTPDAGPQARLLAAMGRHPDWTVTPAPSGVPS